ncbi:hypothetical protein FHS57_000784 [Runella defluvii]|uniref:Uncharacterized protein n=1 Tax=Runella defluvii TaxID=370973 RepID=A0A7W5ZJ03_9BACT|nr:hypothetical protein [Runella defluvii]MBB3836802.1 hypothetical protein [Runella defluvii]
MERKMQGWKPDNQRHERDVRAIGKNVQLTTLPAIVSKTYDSAGVSLVLTIPRLLALE